ncbi:hypothetical protein C4D60_Mb02t10900 [Musa balbisiana]|uniref:Protein kinase domain-containing protein n=1 Tax=Musa balbisiana TaxID=52838 RepID=A0A4S8I9U1_MUSBA|nr:hypothetical protein C4D60_Mb02t10900 [Musa balbisiana]
MESKSTGRFTLGKQSSLAPDRGCSDDSSYGDGFRFPDDVDANIRLMYLTSEGDLEGIEEILASGVDVNFRDIDGRTALHVAACQGFADVVRLLLDRGAQVGPEDRWGSTPLADAIHYNNHEVIDLLEKHGAKLSIIPMHVKNAREVPEYEIDPSELDFTHSVNITKGTFRLATWRGIRVAVKKYGEDVLVDENKLRAFRDELALLQQIRHPNVVQFLGAVTQSSPMMIVTEYLPKGDLRAYLKHKGALKPSSAVRFALDIARNILRDDSGNLKVADFGVSKLLKVAKTVREERSLTHLGTACRYVAPEVFCNEEYDTKVDVFSFALILQEMIEGCPPFCYKQDNEVPKAFVSKQRPPFGAPPKLYKTTLEDDAIKMLLKFQGNVEERKHQQPFVTFIDYKLVTLLVVPMRVGSENAETLIHAMHI